MTKFDRELVSYALGSKRNFARAENKVTTWGELKKLLSRLKVSDETRKAFEKLSKEEQDELKSSNGWISGAQCEGKWRRKANVLPRDLITIDIDYVEASFLDMMLAGFCPGVSEYEFFSHSSRRHTLKNPRLRLFLPMKRKVSIDEYVAIVRYVGWLIDPAMKTVDMVSYRPAQMMFRATCSRDDEKHFVTYENEGGILDPDATLAAFTAQFGDWRDISNHPTSPDESDLRKRADKAEDPTEKEGPVGDFCRAYDIEAAIAKFLSDKYTPGDEHSGNPRYTYTGSTSSNGAVVYDNGKFLYSHHGHDPVCDMNVNAFDLVRIHLYGDQDEDIERKPREEQPSISKRPSFASMIDLIVKDPEFVRQRDIRKFDIESMEEWGDPSEEPEESVDYRETFSSTRPEKADKPAADRGRDFEDDPDISAALDALFDDDEPSATDLKPKKDWHRRARVKPPEDWFSKIEREKKSGEIKSSLNNVVQLVRYDARIRGKIALNQFNKRIVLIGNINPGDSSATGFQCRDVIDGERWQDIHSNAIMAMLDAPAGKGGYGFQPGIDRIERAIAVVAEHNAFHPIREYYDGAAPHWDGNPRVDTLFVDFLKVPDTAYHREVARMMLVGSVARIYEPGHKFDYAAMIFGKTGLRKSTFIKVLYSSRWFGEINCDLGDKQKVAEEIDGKQGVELPELAGFHKTDHNAAKGFMRRQDDSVRPAYGRHVKELLRQCMFWGTTNDRQYLGDATGNRSYLPINIPDWLEFIDTDLLESERDQIWAEAVHLYREMRAAQPRGDLFFDLSPAAKIEAFDFQEDARKPELFEEYRDRLLAWLETPITLTQFQAEMASLSDDTERKMEAFGGPNTDKIMVLRTAILPHEAGRLGLGLPETLTNNQTQQFVAKALNHLPGWARTKNRMIKGTNRRGRFYVNERIVGDDDIGTGYEIVTNPDDVV